MLVKAVEPIHKPSPTGDSERCGHQNAALGNEARVLKVVEGTPLELSGGFRWCRKATVTPSGVVLGVTAGIGHCQVAGSDA